MRGNRDVGRRASLARFGDALRSLAGPGTQRG
jgi:hypothetical protein